MSLPAIFYATQLQFMKRQLQFILYGKFHPPPTLYTAGAAVALTFVPCDKSKNLSHNALKNLVTCVK